MPKGFPTGSSWKGLMPDGTWMYFPTEGEYTEAFWEAYGA